jgi:ATP-dependent RNA helicase RhlE
LHAFHYKPRTGLSFAHERTVLNLFQTMGLPEKLVSRLTAMDINEPTPIQTHAIPHALNGKDVMGLAQTGTGKTAAFGLPLIAQMMASSQKLEPKSVRGLILAPTRELAKQISDNLKGFVQNTPIKIGLVVGGASINPQIARVARGIDILVATPGRLIDLLDRRALSLHATTFLVLDEADQMLDLGFIHSLRKIAGMLPKTRQTMLFSATMPKQMNELANSYLQNPMRVEVSPPGKAADKITQSIHFISKAEKTKLLIELIDKHRDELALVFSRTKHGAEKLMKTLDKSGFSVTSVHGNKSQGQRERALKSFRAGEIKILVATDVAARGLDIPQVRHVYNFDLPNVGDNYVHRIGRTARAGAEGAAIAFCAPDEMGELKAIEKAMGRSIPVASGRPWDDIQAPGGKKPNSRGRSGRKSARNGSQGGAKPGGKPQITGAQKARQRRKAKSAA